MSTTVPGDQNAPDLLPVVQAQGEALGAGADHVQGADDPDPLGSGVVASNSCAVWMTSGLMTAGGFAS